MFDSMSLIKSNKHFNLYGLRSAMLLGMIYLSNLNKNKSSMFLASRSSHLEVSLGKGVLKICSNFTGEHPCQSTISIDEIALRHGCSPVNLLHTFETSFLKSTSGRLLLSIYDSLPRVWVVQYSIVWYSSVWENSFTVTWCRWRET